MKKNINQMKNSSSVMSSSDVVDRENQKEGMSLSKINSRRRTQSAKVVDTVNKVTENVLPSGTGAKKPFEDHAEKDNLRGLRGKPTSTILDYQEGRLYPGSEPIPSDYQSGTTPEANDLSYEGVKIKKHLTGSVPVRQYKFVGKFNVNDSLVESWQEKRKVLSAKSLKRVGNSWVDTPNLIQELNFLDLAAYFPQKKFKLEYSSNVDYENSVSVTVNGNTDIQVLTKKTNSNKKQNKIGDLQNVTLKDYISMSRSANPMRFAASAAIKQAINKLDGLMFDKTSYLSFDTFRKFPKLARVVFNSLLLDGMLLYLIVTSIKAGVQGSINMFTETGMTTNEAILLSGIKYGDDVKLTNYLKAFQSALSKFPVLNHFLGQILRPNEITSPQERMYLDKLMFFNIPNFIDSESQDLIRIRPKVTNQDFFVPFESCVAKFLRRMKVSNNSARTSGGDLYQPLLFSTGSLQSFGESIIQNILDNTGDSTIINELFDAIKQREMFLYAVKDAGLFDNHATYFDINHNHAKDYELISVDKDYIRDIRHNDNIMINMIKDVSERINVISVSDNYDEGKVFNSRWLAIVVSKDTTDYLGKTNYTSSGPAGTNIDSQIVSVITNGVSYYPFFQLIDNTKFMDSWGNEFSSRVNKFTNGSNKDWASLVRNYYSIDSSNPLRVTDWTSAGSFVSLSAEKKTIDTEKEHLSPLVRPYSMDFEYRWFYSDYKLDGSHFMSDEDIFNFSGPMPDIDID